MTLETNVDSTECLYVEKAADSGEVNRGIRRMALGEIEQGFVRIRVEYSSLNYKDALCATGHPGVARTLPIVPGIDAAGKVIGCHDSHFQAGDDVMVFHMDFGTAYNGGLSRIIDVPLDWVYRIPDYLDTRSVMAIGTGGFTAAQCIDELQKHGVTPDKGEIVVTGATGGVGIFAVAMLSQLGYRVIAATGKPDRLDWLQSFGAAGIITREDIDDKTDRPLLSGRWAGAVDTVGGNTLATILRSAKPNACVTACGLVGGAHLDLSVYPFILRGVTLQGIDTAGIERKYREQIWHRIANEWKIDGIEELIDEVDLSGVEDKIQAILKGRIAGRVVVKLGR